MSKPKDVVKEIRRATRRKFTPDEKIRIVLEGLRGNVPITEICRKEGIASAVYYKWSKEFLEAGKNGLTRSVMRDATSDEVKVLKNENTDLKRAVADLTLELVKYKKSLGM
ncbi:MAG: transposase [Candidatus Omnitrophota bacterium]|jgi:transposase